MIKAKDFLLVTIQFLLLIAFGLMPPGFGAPFLLTFLGFSLTVSGILVLGFAFLKLSSNLTPFPTPKQKGTLETNGIYKYIRHPIYTGMLLTTLGIALYSASYGRLIITALLYFLFLYKSKYEEMMLLEKFEDYTDYKKRTGRFFPLWVVNK
jgi:protein-S-isoprenylcysteine O-methyltransferase Ste14